MANLIEVTRWVVSYEVYDYTKSMFEEEVEQVLLDSDVFEYATWEMANAKHKELEDYLSEASYYKLEIEKEEGHLVTELEYNNFYAEYQEG